MGLSLQLKSSLPPYCLGMFSMSMKEDRVGRTSAGERMKILETVTGSNQRLTQPQTVEKKMGAPMICQGARARTRVTN